MKLAIVSLMILALTEQIKAKIILLRGRGSSRFVIIFIWYFIDQISARLVLIYCSIMQVFTVHQVRSLFV